MVYHDLYTCFKLWILISYLYIGISWSVHLFQTLNTDITFKYWYIMICTLVSNFEYWYHIYILVDHDLYTCFKLWILISHLYIGRSWFVHLFQTLNTDITFIYWYIMICTLVSNFEYWYHILKAKRITYELFLFLQVVPHVIWLRHVSNCSKKIRCILY